MSVLPPVFNELFEKHGQCEIIDKLEKTLRNFDPNQTIGMGACIILRDKYGRLVLVPQSIGPEHWFFVCGKNEDGESLEETTIREASEEIGCRVRVTGLHHIGHHYCVVKVVKHSLYYGAALFAEIVSGVPKVYLEEISSVATFRQLPENFLPGHKKYYQNI